MAVFLNQAKTKILNMRKNGTAGSLQITKFKVGNAPYYTVDPNQTDLVSPVVIDEENETYTKSFDQILTLDAFTIQYWCRLAETECNGIGITELALVDADGLVTCIKTFPAKEKTNARDMVFKINDTFVEG